MMKKRKKWSHKNWCRSVTALALAAVMVIPALPARAADGSEDKNLYVASEPKYKVKDLKKETETNHRQPRTVVKLNGDKGSGGWKFQCGNGNSVLSPDSGVTKDEYNDSGWQTVCLPHTWNAGEAHDGTRNTLNKTVGWYRRTIEIQDGQYAGKKVYLEFEGASQVTGLWVNERQVPLCQPGDTSGKIGEYNSHLGGYTQFRYEITDYIKAGVNQLAVSVDNRLDERIAPLSADFNFYGGIYRDVYLVAVDDVHVDMKDLGASGLYLSTPNAGLTSIEKPGDLGKLNIKARIANDSDRSRNITVKATVKGDRAPQPVTQTITIPAGSSVDFNKDTMIQDPHLWEGIRYEEDAANEDVGYQYEVELTVSEGNQVLDCVNEKVGFRWFYVDKDKGFYLNGKSYPLRGVNRHQEKEGYGNAITNEEHYEDLKDIMEMGVNSIRLCHYPQANYFYDLCDANGIVVWTEIPLVNRMGTHEKFDDVTKMMLEELIRQQYNRPSVVMWGLENEVGNAGGTSNNYMNMKQLMNELHLLAKELDDTRLTTQAVNQYVSMNGNNPKHNYSDYSNNNGWNSDVVCWNIYPGWYNNFSGNFEQCMDSYLPLDSRAMGISEYGWGANISQHELYPKHLQKDLTPYGTWHPEEYQNLMHEEALRYSDPKENPQIWGTWLWAMFDFNVDNRYEGDQPELNDKGLITADRSQRKDSYYLHKANWNKQDLFTYISSRRYTEREEAPGYVKVYSNCDEVSMTVTKDGAAAAPVRMTKEGHGVFTVKNMMNEVGTYIINVTGKKGNDTHAYTDEVTWVKTAGSVAELTSEELPVDNSEKVVTMKNPMTLEVLRECLFGVNGAVYQVFDGSDEIADQKAEVRPGMTIKVVSQDKKKNAVYQITAANLSSGKKVTVSSYQTGNLPEHAVDSDSTTRWVAENDTFPQWITVDLGKFYFLNSISIDWYKDGNRYYKYDVSTSMDGTNFTKIVDRTKNTTSGRVTDKLYQQKARYVRIDVKGASAGWAALYEIKVNGWSIEKAENSGYEIDHENRLIILPVDEVDTSITPQDVLDNVEISGNGTFRNDFPTGYVNEGNHLFIRNSDGVEFAYTITGRKNAGAKTTNLALDRPVLFSSEEGTSTSGTDTHAYNLTDGNLTTNWAAATQNGKAVYPEWAAVDLGEICDIESIETYFYKPTQRIYQYKLWGSTDNKDFTLLKDCSANVQKPGAEGKYTDTVPADTKARYIKVEVTGNSEYATNKLAVANLYEIMVHGRKETKDLSIESITLNAESLRMDIGDTFALTASLLPIDATDTKIRWESSKKEVAAVTDGVIKALGSGTTVIKAVSEANENISASCEVTVRKDGIVSMDKPTYYSSEEGVSATGEGTNLAEHVNDGDLATRWTADTKNATLAKYPEWIAVDLGALHEISEIELYLYKYGENNRSYGYEIFISQDTEPQTGKDFSVFQNGYEKLIDQNDNTDKGGHFDHILNQSKKARYVLFKINSCSNFNNNAIAASIYEVSVFGAEAKPDPVDKSELDEAIKTAVPDTEKDKYTEDSWENYQKALKAAKAVQADKDATQKEVSDAAKALTNAQKELKEIEKPDPVDKIALDAAIKAAVPDADKDKYTEDSWENYQKALKAAKAVQADKDATQKEADDAVKALSDAQKVLKEKEQDITTPVEEIFNDIEAENWFTEYVQFVYDHKIMKGLNETTFGPDVILSRAQFATILYRMEQEPEAVYEARFPDVPEEAFYTNAVMWASSKDVGVISGYADQTFGPGDDITREQMAVMMYRYAKYKGYDTSASSDLKDFADRETVSPFADAEMKWAAGAGLIKGDNGLLNPQGTTSRAVCATIIQRFMEAYN